MAGVDDRLEQLGIVLPAVFSAPPGMDLTFELVHVVGDLAYVSGHGPMEGSTPLMQGKVGATLTADDGHRAARLTGLSMLASLKAELGELDRVRRWGRALGLVNCAPGFTNTPRVVNGFSELILEVWGDRGRHARSAIGVAELPFEIPVEVEAVVHLA